MALIATLTTIIHLFVTCLQFDMSALSPQNLEQVQKFLVTISNSIDSLKKKVNAESKRRQSEQLEKKKEQWDEFVKNGTFRENLKEKFTPRGRFDDICNPYFRAPAECSLCSKKSQHFVEVTTNLILNVCKGCTKKYNVVRHATEIQKELYGVVATDEWRKAMGVSPTQHRPSVKVRRSNGDIEDGWSCFQGSTVKIDGVWVHRFRVIKDTGGTCSGSQKWVSASELEELNPLPLK